MRRKVQIAKDKIHSIERRHPWIFSGAIVGDTSKIKDGDLVDVVSENKLLARGYFNSGTIAVKILTFEDEALDNAFFRRKIGDAIAVRRELGLFTEDNTICRIVHGEGDGLPGLIIDYYNKAVVIQCHSVGMYRLQDKIVDALKYNLGHELVAAYSKSSETLPETAECSDGYLFGELEMPHLAKENGITYAINWVSGQKTGFFIDQRENRSLLAKYSAGKKVLNTFCYSGGFSLAALMNNAALVHSLDSSKKAIELTETNIGLNQFDGYHRSIVADAMQYMKNLEELYDIIVLDPPAFAKSRTKRHQAVQGYKRLNTLAIKQIKPGGILFTFSCSQVVDKQLFAHTITAAAIEANRNVRVLQQLHQPCDHPFQLAHPEGEYLKGLVLRVD